MRPIDADALEKKSFKMHGYGDGRFLALGNIRTAPTIDAVPVVRCKDCKRWQRHTEVNRDYGPCRRYGSTMRFDDFCSYGERKENADV